MAAALCAATGASAQSVTFRTAATQSRPAVARSVVLDNIIGRVQLDALIAQIVSSDDVKPAQRRELAYAKVNSTRLRSRS
ncbi:hypothetical protein [Sphingomonas bacterium]|uniref:hypothetical protein n=1 Tax=Sphingomonas bacterium TaxID=1895847 RepID=UPI002613F76E|nr:hypothetical protein [Sphingomonas bacterium]